MLQHMFRAAALDRDFYDYVEGNSALMREVVVVVLLANSLAAIGTFIGYDGVVGSELWDALRGWLGFGSWARPPRGGIAFVIVASIIVALVGWVVWAAITVWVGTRVFGGTTDFGQMFRVLGYAQSPRVIAIVPLLGPVAGVWVLVASVVAIRQGMDFDTPRAIATAIGGWLLWTLLGLAVNFIGASVF
jgi:hypothetical protein